MVLLWYYNGNIMVLSSEEERRNMNFTVVLQRLLLH